MNKTKSLFFIMILLCCAVFLEISPAFGRDVYYISPAYGQLSAAENAAYHQLIEAIINFQPTVDLEEKLSVEQLKRILRIAKETAVEYHYLNSYEYSFRENRVKELRLEYNVNPNLAKSQLEKLNNRVVEIFNGVSSYMDDFECLKYFHDTIINNCRYDLNATHKDSAYGALVEGRASCQGYSRAMILLCRLKDIECIPISGKSRQNEQSAYTSHMWNMVQCNRDWYHMDVTWDDPVGSRDSLGYNYFNLNNAAILRDHQIEPANNFFQIPEARLMWSNYFVKNDLYAENIQQAEAILRRELQRVAGLNPAGPIRIKMADDSDYEKFYNRLFGSEKEIFKFVGEIPAFRKKSGSIGCQHDTLERGRQNIIELTVTS